GYHFGKAKMHKIHRNYHILFALVLPVLLHGIYNYIIITIKTDWISALIPFMIILWYIGLRRVRTVKKRESKFDSIIINQKMRNIPSFFREFFYGQIIHRSILKIMNKMGFDSKNRYHIKYVLQEDNNDKKNFVTFNYFMCFFNRTFMAI